jgi:hypothetical protein
VECGRNGTDGEKKQTKLLSENLKEKDHCGGISIDKKLI